MEKIAPTFKPDSKFSEETGAIRPEALLSTEHKRMETITFLAELDMMLRPFRDCKNKTTNAIREKASIVS